MKNKNKIKTVKTLSIRLYYRVPPRLSHAQLFISLYIYYFKHELEY